jgi:hypothetical protein
MGTVTTKKGACITAQGKPISDLREQELQCGAGQVLTGFRFAMESCSEELEALEEDWIEEASTSTVGGIKTGRYHYTCAPIIDIPGISTQTCKSGATEQQLKFEAGKLVTSANKCLQKGANNLLSLSECSAVAAGTQWLPLGADHMLKLRVGSQNYCVDTKTLTLGACPSAGIWLYDEQSFSIYTLPQSPWSVDLKFNCMRCAMEGNGPKRPSSYVKMYDRVQRITNYANFEGFTRMIQYPVTQHRPNPTPLWCQFCNSLFRSQPLPTDRMNGQPAGQS